VEGKGGMRQNWTTMDTLERYLWAESGRPLQTQNKTVPEVFQ